MIFKRYFLGRNSVKLTDQILHVLNPSEIKALKEFQHVPAAYTDSYKWLLIGFCIRQRVSDLFKLTLKPLL